MMHNAIICDLLRSCAKLVKYEVFTGVGYGAISTLIRFIGKASTVSG